MSTKLRRAAQAVLWILMIPVMAVAYVASAAGRACRDVFRFFVPRR